MEFIYLLLTTLASTWFGISVFYTILDQLIQVTFNSSEVLRQVGAAAPMVQWLLCRNAGSRSQALHSDYC